MLEKQLGGTIPIQRETLSYFDRQVLVGKPNLVPKDSLGGVTVLGNDAAALVRVEQRMIQPHDSNQRRESKLARFQDQVSVPQPSNKPALRLVGPERQNERISLFDRAIGAHLVVALDHDFVERPAEKPFLWVG